MKTTVKVTKLGAWSAALLALLLAGPAAAAPGGGNGGGGGGGGGGGSDPEICDDGIDNDGDGKVDCDDRDCRNDAACADGGGGGDTSDGLRYDYEVLPPGPGTGTIWPEGLSEDRDWIAGKAGTGASCSLMGASLWERTDAAGWVHHSLPGLNGGSAGGGGSALSVLDGGLAVGMDWPRAEPDCPTDGSFLPALWEPLGAGVWSVTQLPSPGSGWGVAAAVADVSGTGLIIVGETAAGGALWQQVGGAWTHVALGSLAADWSTRPFDINSAGVVVGQARRPDNSDGVPFILVPLDMDADGAPDTWFQDLDADGGNDLMVVPTDPSASGGAAGVSAAGDVAGSSSATDGPAYWSPAVGGGWSETALPVDGLTGSIFASELNGLQQVVGTGDVADRRGETVQHGVLWENTGSGWSVSDLNDITALGRFDRVGRTVGINACGDIVALGSTKDEAHASLVLTPRSSACD